MGRVGATGLTSGPNVHYEVRVDGRPVDPRRFFVEDRVPQ
ncbi:MAG: M23 family metallopeptidase [Gemmatimonadota bacterium]